MKRIIQLAFILALAAPAFATQTWFVRPDGGTRYDATANTSGQCDGLGDTAYLGSGTNQHCAYNQYMMMFDTMNSPGGVGPAVLTWKISGGDTVVIRGCAGGPCRVGWTAPTGGANAACPFVGNTNCYNPLIPAGSSGTHTRILGGCAYDGTCTPIDSNYPYGTTNETQIFGGFGLGFVLDLSGTQYVDVAGLEFTTHNAITSGNPNYPNQCITGISSGNQYPATCQNSQPYDDYGLSGLKTDATSANITLTDVMVHGFNSSGIQGPIGGVITGTRLYLGFNVQTGWNFTDIAGNIPNGAGSQLILHGFTCIASGFSEEYPIVHTQFPAKGGWDSNSGGGGDCLSGQDSLADALICDHCVFKYNTKDAFIGPHWQIANLQITNSFAIGNMGSAWKWGDAVNATVLFQNNLTNGNCWRPTEIIPGAAQNFYIGTGLPGSYLDNFCRAGGATFAINSRAGAVSNFIGNTTIDASNIILQVDCGYYTVGNVFHRELTCGTAPNVLKNNLWLGYVDPFVGAAPSLYCAINAAGNNCDSSFPAGTGVDFTASYTNEFGIRFGSGQSDTCGGTILCVDPLLLNEPAQTWPGSETDLDVFDALVGGNSFYPTGSSPLISAGTPVGGLTADYYGTSRTNPPWLGGVNSLSGTSTVATPTFSPVAGTYTGTQTVTISTSTSGATLCYTVDGSTPAAATPGTCSHGTTYSTPVSVASSLILKALGTKAAFTNSAVASGVYTITAPPAVNFTIFGTVTMPGTNTIP